MEITCVNDWQKIRLQLRDNILGLSNAKTRIELTKMLSNMDILIKTLSTEEVQCRRLHKQTQKHIELIKEINERIEFLDQMITFGAIAT